MYWSDWGEPAKIERASMDGNNREVLHDTDLTWPNGLAIDYDLQRLYWVDSYYRKIEFSDVDGHRRDVLLYLESGFPFFITISGDQIYWTDLANRTVHSAHKEFVISTLTVYTAPSFVTPIGIEAVHPNRQHTESKE